MKVITNLENEAIVFINSKYKNEKYKEMIFIKNLALNELYNKEYIDTDITYTNGILYRYLKEGL